MTFTGPDRPSGGQARPHAAGRFCRWSAVKALAESYC